MSVAKRKQTFVSSEILLQAGCKPFSIVAESGIELVGLLTAVWEIHGDLGAVSGKD